MNTLLLRSKFNSTEFSKRCLLPGWLLYDRHVRDVTGNMGEPDPAPPRTHHLPGEQGTHTHPGSQQKPEQVVVVAAGMTEEKSHILEKGQGGHGSSKEEQGHSRLRGQQRGQLETEDSVDVGSSRSSTGLGNACVTWSNEPGGWRRPHGPG